MRIFTRNLLMIVMLMVALPVAAAESGVVLKDEIVRKEPYSDAKQVGVMKAGDKVSIIKKDGGWLNIKSGKSSGWVRMLSVRRGTAEKSRNMADSLKTLASGRTGTGHVVATTGIRGLNEEELKSAKFNAVELGKMDKFAVSANEAKTFAAQGKLKPRSFDYLPVPK